MKLPITVTEYGQLSQPGTAVGSLTPISTPPWATQALSAVTSAASCQASPPLQAVPARPALMTTSTPSSLPALTSSKLRKRVSTGRPESASLMWMRSCM